MFIWPDGTVTGSIRWGELEEVVAARSDENVTDEGWARLDSLLAERAGASASQAPAERAADEDEPEEDPYDGETVESLKQKLRDRDLPTSGNKAELFERLRAAEQMPADVANEDDTPEEE